MKKTQLLRDDEMIRIKRNPEILMQALEPRLLLSGTQYDLSSFDTSPALFIENQGQWPSQDINYLYNARNTAIALTSTGPVFHISRPTNAQQSDTFHESDTNDPLTILPALESHEFSAKFIGANQVQPLGLDKSSAVFNYQVGHPDQWRSNVSAYQTVVYPDLYDGIDLYLYPLSDSLKYEFHLDPGANPEQIQVQYTSIDGLSIDSAGNLNISPLDDWQMLTDDAPYTYQDSPAGQIQVESAYHLLSDSTYKFELGDYDNTKPLVIDPRVDWGSYIGGTASEYVKSVDFDHDGNIIIAGPTGTPGWLSQEDVFIVKLSPDGQLIWMTTIGGKDADYLGSISIDNSNNILITGTTTSDDWIDGGMRTELEGVHDGYIVKLNPDGQHLWSSYISGNESQVYDVSTDSFNNVVIVGSTDTEGWLHGGWDTTINGNVDAFVMKLSSNGQHLWSSYLGGADTEWAPSVSVDLEDNIVIAGVTRSVGWVSGGWQTDHGSGIEGDDDDSYIAKFNSDGEHLWSTFLGGIKEDRIRYMDLDADNNILVSGYTNSDDWGISGGYRSTRGTANGVLLKFNPDGEHLWSTYVPWRVLTLAVDYAGNIIIAADYNSVGSINDDGWVSSENSDVFFGIIQKLNANGEILWSSHLGRVPQTVESRSNRTGVEAIATDQYGDFIIAGSTRHEGWLSEGWDAVLSGERDGYVLKIDIPFVAGDFNLDEKATVTDIGLLAKALRDGNTAEYYDAEQDGDVDTDDMDYLITEIFNTQYGDANLDGEVNLDDLATLATHFGQSNLGWGQGDYSEDGNVNLEDLARLATNFGFDNSNITGGGATAILSNQSESEQQLEALIVNTKAVIPQAINHSNWNHIGSLLDEDRDTFSTI